MPLAVMAGTVTITPMVAGMAAAALAAAAVEIAWEETEERLAPAAAAAVVMTVPRIPGALADVVKSAYLRRDNLRTFVI